MDTIYTIVFSRDDKQAFRQGWVKGKGGFFDEHSFYFHKNRRGLNILPVIVPPSVQH